MTGWTYGNRTLSAIGYAPYGKETYTYGNEVVRYETGVWIYSNSDLGEITRAYSYADYPWLAVWNSPFTASKVCPPPPPFSPADLANLRLWVDAREGAFSTLGNYFTDENASVDVTGFYNNTTVIKQPVPRNGRPEYRTFNYEIFWDPSISKWTVYVNDCCDEEGNSYFAGTFTGIGDVPYPWLANWTGSGGNVTRTPTTQDTLAINNQSIEKWLNKVLNSDNLILQEEAGYAEPIFKENIFGHKALFFNNQQTLYANSIADTNFDKEFSFYIVATSISSPEETGVVIKLGSTLQFGIGDAKSPTLRVVAFGSTYNSNTLKDINNNSFGLFSVRGNFNDINPVIKVGKNLEVEEIVPVTLGSIDDKQIIIGSSNVFATSNEINTNIAEILVYKEYHDDAKAQKIFDYLVQKYNINTNPVSFAPDSLPELKLWADAEGEVYNFIGNDFTDETANITTAGFALVADGVDPNANFYVSGELNNRNTYSSSLNGGDVGGRGDISWNGSNWVLEIQDYAPDDPPSYYYVNATGDTQYPWNANWGAGKTITRDPTTNTIVATDGMTVTQWNNKVVGKGDLRQDDINLQPIYKSNFNGKPAIFFNGDVLHAGNFGFSNQYSYYLVTSDSLSGSGSSLAGAIRLGTSASTIRGVFGANNTFIGASNGTSRISTISNASGTGGRVWSARFNVSNSGQAIVGSNKNYQQLSSVGTSNAGIHGSTITLGALNSTGGTPITSHFREVLVYRTFHTEAIASKIVDYLAAKWGITL
jgi:hypothetical protein